MPDRSFGHSRAELVPTGCFAFAARLIETSRHCFFGSERLVAIEPRERGLVATTLRSHEEVRAMKDYFADIPAIRPDPEMIAIAAKIISQKEADFDPSEFNAVKPETLDAVELGAKSAVLVALIVTTKLPLSPAGR